MRRLLMIIAACMLFFTGFASFHIENTSGEKMELSDSLVFSHPEIIEHGDGCVTVEIERSPHIHPLQGYLFYQCTRKPIHFPLAQKF